MKKLIVVLLALMICLTSAAQAETHSVLTQEQYDQMDAWFAQVWETIPADDKGQTISGSKFIVAMKEPGTGVYTSLPDDGLTLDMSAFPRENLAATYEEADTLIMIYPVYKVTGQYFGMAIPVSARKTYTTICAVDLTTGTVGAPFCAVVRDAPKSVQIETRNGIPLKNAVNGSFEPQKALEKVEERLVISEAATAEIVYVSGFPAELAGEWSGTGIPKNGGTSIDLAVSIIL